MNYDVVPESFASLIGYWKSPQNKLHWSSVFVLPAWLEAWWQSFTPDAELRLLGVKQENDIIGLAPLMVREKTASFVGSTDVCDYMDFVAVPGKEAEFCDVLLEEMPHADVESLRLEHLRPDATVLRVLAPLAVKKGYKVKQQEDAVSLELDLPRTFEEYLALLDGKQRHEVRRKLRRLEEAGDVKYECREDHRDIEGQMDAFFRLFAMSETEKAGFMTAPREAFFRTVTEAMAGIGVLRLGSLEVNGALSAMVLGFAFRDTFYLYNSTYDPAAGHLSVGVLTKVLCIREAITHQLRKWDFLKGAETYKSHLGGVSVPLYRCEIELK